MRREYEVKIRLEGDLNEVREALRSIGGVLIESVKERDYYIDLSRCAGGNDIVFRIRVREVGNARYGELTVKGPKLFIGSIKVRDEVNARLDKAYDVVSALRNLGFRIMCVSKTREVYSLPGFKVFLDNVIGLGNYVEIEIADVDDVDKALTNIANIANKLGIKGEVVFKSYLEMLLESGKECIEL